MWMVYENEEGLVCVTDNYDEALTTYKRCKENQEDWVRGEGEFSTDETVILAKVERYLYSVDSGKIVMEEDEEGNESPTKDTYWEFKEDIY